MRNRNTLIGALVVIIVLLAAGLGISVKRSSDDTTPANAQAVTTTPSVPATAPAATPTPPPDIKVNPAVAKIFESYLKDSSVTLEAAKGQIKSLGYTDAQIDGYVKDLLAKAPSTSPTPGNTPAATPTKVPATAPTAVPSAAPTVAPTTAPATSSGNAFEKRVLTSKGSIPNLPNDLSHNGWTIKAADTALDPAQDGIVGDILRVLEAPNPSQWQYYPNVPNPARPDFPTSAEQPAPWGAEYGEDESPFCENHPCDYVVSAWSYRMSSGDQSVLGQACPPSDKATGCLRLVINVMNETTILRDQDVDNGWTVAGRYWDGKHMQWAILGLTSHASANMLGMKTYSRLNEILNSGNGDNAGANCGTPDACKSVDVLVIILAGDRILATAHTVVKPDTTNSNFAQKTSAPLADAVVDLTSY